MICNQCPLTQYCSIANTQSPTTQCGYYTLRSLNPEALENIHLILQENTSSAFAFRKLLREVLIRFDNAPKNYTKMDYKKLISLFSLFKDYGFGFYTITDIPTLDSTVVADSYIVLLEEDYLDWKVNRFSLLVLPYENDSNSESISSTQIAYVSKDSNAVSYTRTVINGEPTEWVKHVELKLCSDLAHNRNYIIEDNAILFDAINPATGELFKCTQGDTLRFWFSNIYDDENESYFDARDYVDLNIRLKFIDELTGEVRSTLVRANMGYENVVKYAGVSNAYSKLFDIAISRNPNDNQLYPIVIGGLSEVQFVEPIVIDANKIILNGNNYIVLGNEASSKSIVSTSDGSEVILGDISATVQQFSSNFHIAEESKDILIQGDLYKSGSVVNLFTNDGGLTWMVSEYTSISNSSEDYTHCIADYGMKVDKPIDYLGSGLYSYDWYKTNGLQAIYKDKKILLAGGNSDYMGLYVVISDVGSPTLIMKYLASSDNILTCSVNSEFDGFLDECSVGLYNSLGYKVSEGDAQIMQRPQVIKHYSFSSADQDANGTININTNSTEIRRAIHIEANFTEDGISPFSGRVKLIYSIYGYITQVQLLFDAPCGDLKGILVANF